MTERSADARNYRHWTTREVAVLREHYCQKGGPARCAELLPHRGLHAVYARAQKLGLRAPNPAHAGGQRFARKWHTTTDIDAQITATYRTLAKRGDIKRLALDVGRPKWWVCKRAVVLGLTLERIKPLEWSSAEMHILEQYAGCTLQTIRAKLKAGGFARSETAIAVQLKRAKIDRTDPDVWSARDLGALLGVDGKTICDWVARRGLVAQRLPGELNRSFRITRKALRAWLVEHHGYVDLRRVDQPWFWGLVL